MLAVVTVYSCTFNVRIVSGANSYDMDLDFFSLDTYFDVRYTHNNLSVRRKTLASENEQVVRGGSSWQLHPSQSHTCVLGDAEDYCSKRKSLFLNVTFSALIFAGHVRN